MHWLDPLRLIRRLHRDADERRRSEAADAVGKQGLSVSLAELMALRVEARRLRLGIGGWPRAMRAGGHVSRFRGVGVEYDESRAYVPGDDTRLMDWRVTARTTRPHVKVHREERERPLWLFVDQGPTMRFATRVAFKSVVAARAAALLGWLAVGRGDRVGGFVADGTRRRLRPPAGRVHGQLVLLRALAELSSPDADAGGDRSRPFGPGRSGVTWATALSRGLPTLGFLDVVQPVLKQVRPGSLVFLLSDFAGGVGDGAWLAGLADHSDVVIAFIQDPVEAWAPPAGRWPVLDAREGADALPRLVDLRSPGRRAWYERQLARHRDSLFELARDRGAFWLGLTTDEPVGAAVTRFLGAGRA